MATENLAQRAYREIKEKIVYCEYYPGAMINEQKICAELGYSRTPVREALNRLEQDRFVRILPKKGVLVADVSLGDIAQIYQVRMVVEPLVIHMAGPHLPEGELRRFRERFTNEQGDNVSSYRLDTAMHLFIIGHCGNEYLIEMMRRVFEKNTQVIIASGQDRVAVHDARQEHAQLLDYLLLKDYRKASDYMRIHLENCRKSAFEHIYNLTTATFPADTSYLTYMDRLYEESAGKGFPEH